MPSLSRLLRTFLNTLAAPLAALAAFSHPAALRASIFGVDDRMTDGRADARFWPVGIVSGSSIGRYGTAFLVGPCHALTAKHLIYHPEPIGRTVTLRFEPWRQSSPSNTTKAVVVAAGGKPVAKGDYSQDWAVLRLDQCLGRTFGYFSLSNAPLKILDGGRGIAPGLIAVGYPKDKRFSRGPTIDPSCQVKLITSFGLLHDCATLPGNSGGPMIGWNAERGQFEAFAITVAGYDNRTPNAFDLHIANIAVALQPILMEIQTAIRRGMPGYPQLP